MLAPPLSFSLDRSSNKGVFRFYGSMQGRYYYTRTGAYVPMWSYHMINAPVFLWRSPSQPADFSSLHLTLDGDLKGKKYSSALTRSVFSFFLFFFCSLFSFMMLEDHLITCTVGIRLGYFMHRAYFISPSNLYTFTGQIAGD